MSNHNYYTDYDESKEYYRILFRPRLSVISTPLGYYSNETLRKARRWKQESNFPDDLRKRTYYRYCKKTYP